MARIRYEYTTMVDGRLHVITSPDMKGFYITADSREQVYAEADRVLAAVDRLLPDGANRPTERAFYIA